ncbi:hypothetical protein M9H77_07895 [Catharanthus roseus]|uniref:Uncharacterized protein n=1 Tax=Catharanthus roseus TaxID=4058 RepID=A0ACC0BW97_CATRO|nr:hypothetical protein M9H77_07895 [Catharanthus roseus]
MASKPQHTYQQQAMFQRNWQGNSTYPNPHYSGWRNQLSANWEVESQRRQQQPPDFQNGSFNQYASHYSPPAIHPVSPSPSLEDLVLKYIDSVNTGSSSLVEFLSLLELIDYCLPLFQCRCCSIDAVVPALPPFYAVRVRSAPSGLFRLWERYRKFQDIGKKLVGAQYYNKDGIVKSRIDVDWYVSCIRSKDGSGDPSFLVIKDQTQFSVSHACYSKAIARWSLMGQLSYGLSTRNETGLDYILRTTFHLIRQKPIADGSTLPSAVGSTSPSNWKSRSLLQTPDPHIENNVI